MITDFIIVQFEGHKIACLSFLNIREFDPSIILEVFLNVHNFKIALVH